MKITGPFFDTPTDAGGGKPVSDSDTAVLDNLLEQEDAKEEGKDELPEEKEELEEIPLTTEPDEEKEEEKDELPDTNVRAVDFNKIKEKYPDFTKTNEYRELRNSYHREAKFSEIFPTIDDAQEAANNNETFNKLNEALVGRGDVSTLFAAVKEASPEAVKKIASGFLDSLFQFDKSLYVETVNPLVKRLARQINSEGRKRLSRNAEDEDGQALVATARNIMNYAFEDPDLVDKDDERIDPRVTAKERELSERENAIRQQNFKSAFMTVSESADSKVIKLISEGLDPDGRFNDFTKDSLLEKIKDRVYKQLNNDQSHIKRMDSLWRRAEQQGYTRESLSRIYSAYLERARPIIAVARRELRNKALGDISRKPEESINIPKGQRGGPPSRDGKVNLRAVDPKKIDYSNTSDEDIFNGRVKLRG